MANFAACSATAFSKAWRLSSGADCLLAQAPIWARRGREVGVGRGVFDSFHRPAQTHLAVDRLPVKKQRALSIPIQFSPFLAVDIGKEHESSLVEAFHQHHADIGEAVGIDGGQRHGGRIARLAAACFLEPGGKQPQRLVRLGEITTR